MTSKLDIYFFIPAGTPANTSLLWKMADKYGLEFKKSGECYGQPLNMASEAFEYKTLEDGIFVHALPELLRLDHDKQNHLRQNWCHRSSGIEFTSTFASIDKGGHVVHIATEQIYTDADFESFIGNKYRKQEFWSDLSAGYEASFFASADLYKTGFRELYAQFLSPRPSADERWMRR